MVIADILAIFRIRAAEFSAVTDEVVEAFISYAINEIDPETFTDPEYATALLAAHKLSVKQYNSGGATGSVVSDKSSKLERKYAVNSSSKSMGLHSSTQYGIEFDTLINKSVFSIFGF